MADVVAASGAAGKAVTKRLVEATPGAASGATTFGADSERGDAGAVPCAARRTDAIGALIAGPRPAEAGAEMP